MSSLETFNLFYVALVESLPMSDASFVAMLYRGDLLPGNILQEIRANSTNADKAAHFLDRVIKPSLKLEDSSGFKKLLNILQDGDYMHVKQLSHKIISHLKEESSDLAG